MALKQRTVDWRSIRHAIPWSKEHQEDVQANRERQNIHWVGVDVDYGDRHQVIEGLGEGIIFVVEGGAVVPCTEEYFCQHMDQQTRERSWYYREVNDPKTNSGKRMKKFPTSLGQWGCSAAPWNSQRIYELAKKGETKQLLALFESLANRIKTEFEERTKREVLTVEVHSDTQHIHVHLFHSRVDLNTHKFIAGTEKGLSTIGDWACAVLRQKRYGAVHPMSKNARSAERYRERVAIRSGADPVDNAIHIAVDQECEKFLGSPSSSQRMSWWLQDYIRRVPLVSMIRLMALVCGCQKEIALIQQTLRVADFAMQQLWAEQKQHAPITLN